MFSCDILFYISKFLKPLTRAVFMSSSKLFTISHQYKLLQTNLMWGKNIPQVFLPFIEVPILDIGTRIGRTGYIDFIKACDMTYTVQRGTDHYRRAFIAIKHDRGVMTLFQRYTDNLTSWNHGGHLPDNMVISGYIQFISDPLDQRLQFLLSKLA